MCGALIVALYPERKLLIKFAFLVKTYNNLNIFFACRKATAQFLASLSRKKCNTVGNTERGGTNGLI